MSVFDDLLEANDYYASGLDSSIALPPARDIAIVTCMDARIVPALAFGVAEIHPQVIRNAGGRTPEALRSLVISQRLLGTKAVAVIQHTQCGMLTFTNEDLHAKVRKDLGVDASHIDFLPFTDLEQNVRDDVTFLHDSPLISAPAIYSSWGTRPRSAITLASRPKRAPCMHHPRRSLARVGGPRSSTRQLRSASGFFPNEGSWASDQLVP